ncbi:MAG: peptidylprolyl isomerase [Desulfitobacteriaceae bacterium]
MKKSRVGIVAVLLVMMLLVTTGCTSLVGGKWVAKVNGTSISLEKYNVRVNDAKQIYEKQGADFTSEQGKKDLPQLKNQILDRMLEAEIINQEDKKLGLKADDPKVKAEEEGIKKGMGTDAQFQEVLKQQGMTETELQKFLALYLKQTSELKLSDSDIKAYFDKNQAQYGQPEQVKARHILLKTEDEAKQIIVQLKAGGNFEQLAKEKSTEPGAKDSGGELGYFPKGKMAPEFEKAAFAQKVGDYSTEPVKTDFGYHVILVEDHKQASVPVYATIKDKVEKDALNQAKDENFQTYYDELRKKAKIVYATGYDPAAPAPAPAPGK